MRALKYSAIISTAALILTGCSSHNSTYNIYHPPLGHNLVASPTAVEYYPYQVKIYNAAHRPRKPYEDVAQISVDKVDEYGLMRQKARIKTLLREEATLLGGDAIIILPEQDSKTCKAEVIKFTKTKSTPEASTSGESSVPAQTS